MRCWRLKTDTLWAVSKSWGLYSCNNTEGKVGQGEGKVEGEIPTPSKLYHGK